MKLRANGIGLRLWRDEDAPALITACQDPEIVRWLPVIPSPYGEQEARDYLEQCRLNWELGEAFNFAIVDEPGHLLGSIAMRVLRFRVGHIGYWVVPDARRRGVASTALQLLCRWAIEEVGMKRLELMTDPDNLASQGVAERAGFRREAVLRSNLEYRDGSRRDSVMFSLLPDELRRA
jgi:RimJ/RimL family protein N-acetyltransferase